MKKINWEEVSFQIIVEAGNSKSLGMEALQIAKKKDFKVAEEKLKEANLSIGKASHLHMDVITQEAQGTQHDFKVLFMHAEDQLLTTQTLLLVIEELIEVWKNF